MIHPKCRKGSVLPVVLLLAAITWLAGPSPGAAGPVGGKAAGTAIATDVISAGGGEGISASFRLQDTFGQGPIGPLAVGATITLQDGFWATVGAKGAPEDTTPPNPVATFEAFPGDTSIGLGWTNPSDPDFAGILIRFSTTAFPATPTDGAPVPNGHSGEFWNLPGVGDDYVHGGLINGTTYYYTAFAFDSTRNYSTGVSISGAPLDTIPPTAVTAFTATAGDTSITLRWTNPDDSDFDHALVRFSTTSHPKTTTEGTAVPNGGNGEFPNVSASVDSFVHTHLTNGVTYYYSIWSADEVPNYSGYWDVSATPADTVPPGLVQSFDALAGERSVKLKWQNPTDGDLYRVHIRYSTSAYPASPSAGTPVEGGSGGWFSAAPAAADSFAHTGLTAGTTYYYTIWTYDEALNFNHDLLSQDLAVPYDNTPPQVAVSVFQNPYVTNHLDIYLVANEAVSDSSVHLTVNGSAVTMEVNNAVDYVYRGDYDLCCTGALALNGCARDIAGNRTCDARAYSSSLLFAATGGTAESADGQFRFTVPDRALAGNTYILISESEVSGNRVYEVSPAGLALGEMAEVSIGYTECSISPEHLCLARVEDDHLTDVECFVDRDGSRVLAYVDKPGTFGLIERPDVVTPAYGAGKFNITRNVPNPFVGSTEIEFSVARAGSIEAEIVSVDGRHVRTLVDNYVTPGRHRMTWDGCDDAGRRVAGGLYVCRANFGSEQANHKMVHLH